MLHAYEKSKIIIPLSSIELHQCLLNTYYKSANSSIEYRNQDTWQADEIEANFRYDFRKPKMVVCIQTVIREILKCFLQHKVQHGTIHIQRYFILSYANSVVVVEWTLNILTEVNSHCATHTSEFLALK